MTAAEARAEAQRIAFGPVFFQACQAMRRTGLLQRLVASADDGATEGELAADTALSPYALRVLLDMALAGDVAWQRGDRYGATRVGLMLATDVMTGVNLDFVDDVCYAGMARLTDSIRSGRPSGLSALGPWSTIYEGLGHLPEEVRRSWFGFDNYYSDRSYPLALPIVFRGQPRTIMDVGANNGNWSRACLEHDPAVHMIAVDLPGQLLDLERNLRAGGHRERVTTHPVDLLDPAATLPHGADVIWMSQFLDCFNEQQVVSILRKARAAMHPGTSLFIMETFIDRQRFGAGTFALAATSLYFTAMANGNSRMYRAEHFEPLVAQAGLSITERFEDLGVGHTLLHCKPR